MQKTLNNINGEDAKAKVSDIEFFGNPDTFQLISKASSKSQGWMKSTKAMEIKGVGCIVQVTSEHFSLISGETTTCGEAIQFVPGVKIVSRDGIKSLEAL